MRKLLLIGACLALAACGGADDEAAKTDEPYADEPYADDTYEDRETVFDPMTDTIDRAKEVEEMGKDRKKAMDEALEGAEGRDPE
jgi:ABC-type glycerol-3-phosphate transport system substrate-binding protein